MTTLDSRIYRADKRMVQAKCAKWSQLWCAMFYRLVDRRNAMAMVRAVRHEKKQPLAPGAVGGGSGVVVPLPLSQSHPTTFVVDREEA
jgi:hypothetical protein